MKRRESGEKIVGHQEFFDGPSREEQQRRPEATPESELRNSIEQERQSFLGNMESLRETNEGLATEDVSSLMQELTPEQLENIEEERTRLERHTQVLREILGEWEKQMIEMLWGLSPVTWIKEAKGMTAPRWEKVLTGTVTSVMGPVLTSIQIAFEVLIESTIGGFWSYERSQRQELKEDEKRLRELPSSKKKEMEVAP